MHENLVTAADVRELAQSVKLDAALVRWRATNELSVVSRLMSGALLSEVQPSDCDLIVSQLDLEILGGTDLEDLTDGDYAELARCLNENLHERVEDEF